MTQIPEAFSVEQLLWFMVAIALPDYVSYVRNSYTICHHAGFPASQHAMTRIVKAYVGEIIFIPVNILCAQ